MYRAVNSDLLTTALLISCDFTQQSASKDAADSTANDDSRSSSQSNSKSPALVPSGDDAPRISPLIGLPSIMRPLFPGHGESVHSLLHLLHNNDCGLLVSSTELVCLSQHLSLHANKP
jgi:hypothetical protein